LKYKQAFVQQDCIQEESKTTL